MDGSGELKVLFPVLCKVKLLCTLPQSITKCWRVL